MAGRSPHNIEGIPKRITCHQSRQSACERSFLIFEIAERILLNLSMGDILCGAQQVCRQWQGVIRDSTRLQQALFFQPITETPVRTAVVIPDIIGTDYWVVAHKPFFRVTVVEHPYTYLLSLDFDVEVISRPEASWRRQLVTQPPLRVAVVNWDEFGDELPVFCADRQGLRMGDIDALGEFYWIHGWAHWVRFEGYDQLKEIRNALQKKIQAYRKSFPSEDEVLSGLESLFGRL